MMSSQLLEKKTFAVPLYTYHPPVCVRRHNPPDVLGESTLAYDLKWIKTEPCMLVETSKREIESTVRVSKL